MFAYIFQGDLKVFEITIFSAFVCVAIVTIVCNNMYHGWKIT